VALTKARKAAAAQLDAAVAGELPPLKMERARFVTDITDAPESALGTDQVRFTVSTNPGTPLGPLDKIASGGEMARFALAIKVALAAKTQSVMVFDEVDQGVGGAVATAVGRRLARLSETSQVFVVTHSPQVAAAADHQFRIEKTSDGDTTNTHVHQISEEQREEEIARMLAGDVVTDAARAAARDLIG
jgi:DNA repair protein RecN (Recombination protein N)